jgi:hypothetical protein
MFNWRPVYDIEQRTSQLRRENARSDRVQARALRAGAFVWLEPSVLRRRFLAAPPCADFALIHPLLPLEFVHYDRLWNPITVVDGAVGDLQHPLDPHPFSKGFSHRFARHCSYSSFEAQQILRNRAVKEPFSMSAAFFERDFNRRRFHQKELSYRLPARPLIKFLLLFVLKCGFVDGRPGFTYVLLQSIYEAMIVLKVRELEQPPVSVALPSYRLPALIPDALAFPFPGLALPLLAASPPRQPRSARNRGPFPALAAG